MATQVFGSLSHDRIVITYDSKFYAYNHAYSVGLHLLPTATWANLVKFASSEKLESRCILTLTAHDVEKLHEF